MMPPPATAPRKSFVKSLMPRRWRLQSSLILTAAALFAVLMLLTAITYRDTIARERVAEVENAVALARVSATLIDEFIKNVEGTTLVMALDIGSRRDGITQDTVGSYLTTTIQHYRELRSLFVTDLAGRVVAAQRAEGVGVNLSRRSYVQALRSGRETIWSDGLIGMRSGEVTLAFGRVIKGPDGARRGYLLAAFYPSRVIAALPPNIPADARVTLIDRRGVVLHTTHVGITREQRDVGGRQFVRRALAGHITPVTGPVSLFGQEGRYGAFVPIPSTGWVVGFTRPLAPLEDRLRLLALRQVAVITIAVLAAILIFVMIARRLIGPLRHLAENAIAIGRGERPALGPVEGPAEVSDLSTGMAAMSRAVAHREDTLHFLAEASKEFSRSLDYEATLSNVARLAVPRIADWCVVDIAAEGGEVRRLAVEHVDPAKVELARDVQRRYPTDPESPTGVPNVLRTGRSELYPEITEAMLRQAAKDEEHLRILQKVGLTSVIIVPLPGRDRTLGAITFVNSESGRRFSHADLELAEDLARRAGMAIENARLFARQRGIAETLQRSLLRKDLPEMPGVTAAARYLPAKTEVEVGGDWYDLFALPDSRIAMVMGDVAGSGLEAASVMGQLQHALRAYAQEGHAPASVMERLNMLLELKDMATLVFLIFDPATWTVTYANAGHLPPMTIAPDGRVSMLEGGSPPLGGSPLTMYRESSTTLTPGSTILLYTDGLIEVRGESIDVGLDRMSNLLAESGTGDLEALLERILAVMVGGEGAADDVALLALRAEALDPARLRLRIAATPTSLPLVRHTLRRWLGQAGATSEDIYDISVATAEACANSIEHAYQAGDARLEIDATHRDSQIFVTVRDWGQWREPRGKHRGRGLILMRGLMDTVQVAHSDDGTTVQMRRRLKREARA
ncbi:MAG TPA: SpoIIE family protein phosphatase [bacterium]|nr:SpoIIE family protein phosphatase [bacterium]